MSALQEEELVISLWDYLIERTNFVSIELKTFSVDFETHPVSDIPERRHLTEKQLKHSLAFQKNQTEQVGPIAQYLSPKTNEFYVQEEDFC